MRTLKHLAVMMMVVLTATANAFAVTLKQTQSVFEGDDLELLCKADRPLESCEFKLTGFDSSLRVSKGVKKPSYAFFGDFQHGVCGIRISSANRTNHGPATCQVSYPNENYASEATCNVTVQHMPKNVELHSNKPNFEFDEGDLMEFKCTADGGFPPPIITMLYNKQFVNVTTNNNLLSWSKVADVSDFDKRIECVVDHPNLTNQRFVYSRFVTVKAAPKLNFKLEEGGVYEAKGNFTVGQNATIQVPVCAYPTPHLIEWTRAGQKLDHTRFKPWNFTKKFLHDAMTNWIFGLDISNLTDADLGSIFEISIWNDLSIGSIPVKIRSAEVNNASSTTAKSLVVLTQLLVLLLLFSPLPSTSC